MNSWKSWMEEQLFHFSTKPVNSNAPAAGVRVGKEQLLDLPHLSLRTLLAENVDIDLDYINNTGGNATHFKQLRQHLGEIESKDALDLVETATVREEYKLVGSKDGECNLGQVSKRLRQLLIPKEDDYVSLTPLSSPGLCQYLRQKGAEWEQASDGRKLKKIRQFSVGGANPQNAGGRVRGMRPYVFMRAPQISEATRAAFAIAFKGFRPRLPAKLVQDYAEWLAKQERPEEEIQINLRLREQEQKHLRILVETLERQAQRARNLLLDHQRELRNIVSEWDLFSTGWLNPLERSPQWRGEVALWLVNQLSRYELPGSGRLIFTEEDQRRLLYQIEEVCL